jgi:HTH-type transcriptional regulator/antitoxin HipB
MQQTIATPHQMGQILATGRRRAELTQAEAALRVGVSQSRISVLETDASALTLKQLLALLGAYGLQLQIQDKDSPPPLSVVTGVEW